MQHDVAYVRLSPQETHQPEQVWAEGFPPYGFCKTNFPHTAGHISVNLQYLKWIRVGRSFQWENMFRHTKHFWGGWCIKATGSWTSVKTTQAQGSADAVGYLHQQSIPEGTQFWPIPTMSCNPGDIRWPSFLRIRMIRSMNEEGRASLTCVFRMTVWPW